MGYAIKQLIWRFGLLVLTCSIGYVVTTQTLAAAELVPAEQTVPTATPTPECWPNDIAAGAIAGQPLPVFCSITNSGPGTSMADDNAWYDEFDHGLSFASFDDTNYRIFVDSDIHEAAFWRHANHWMVDLAPEAEDNSGHDETIGSVMLSPNATFRFEEGRFIVETVYAAGHPDYAQNAWGEIIVSTGDHPVYPDNDAGETPRGGELYGLDMFPNEWTLGCRLHAHSTTVCALMINNDLSIVRGGRLWEMSYHQLVGDTVFGGHSNGTNFRFCAEGAPDSECREHFKLELTATTVTIFINGDKYFEQTGVPALPTDFMNGDLHVFLASTTSQHDADTIRYHWDHFAVNSPEPPDPDIDLPYKYYLPIAQ